jgi:two-component system response regulator FlrC
MRLLIIGTMRGPLATAAQIAMARGASISNAESIAQGLSTLRLRGADLLFIDLRHPIDEIAKAMKEDRISTPIIACGIDPSPEEAAAAIRAGAREFLPLPPDPELIAAILEAVTTEKHDLIWRDPAMEKAIRMAEAVAKSDASILITGESGTGKEVIARLIHKCSKRSAKPFISVNCAAIPDSLLESELFGHEKGAFTGASHRRIGKFEEAHGGTLLLDEISEMDIRLQAKLLRAIQERVIDRIGGTKPVPVDLRILATSNRALPNSVAKGEFREDLYFRLNVVSLRIPALRERPQDILPLAHHFIHHFSLLNDVPERKMTADAKRKLLAAPWRGNVRELENIMHRAVLLADGSEITPDVITLDDDPRLYQQKDIAARAVDQAETITRALVGKTVSDVEQGLILDTLDHCLGNRTQAARILGISIRTLRNKLNDYASRGVDISEHHKSQMIA